MVENGYLTLEYILDGKKLKLGDGELAKAAQQASDDYIDWNPKGSTSSEERYEFDIADSHCNPWYVSEAPKEDPSKKSPKFQPQVTAPIPLEGVYDYFETMNTKREEEYNSALMPSNNGRGYRFREPSRLEWVREEYFQASPNGFKTSEKDVLAFFSLVMSYIKGAEKLDEESPKELSKIMPRTNFPTIYGLVKDKIKGNTDKLYDIVKILACYTSDEWGTQISLDQEFCSGPLSDPVPNGKIDGLEYNLSDENGGKTTRQIIKVQDWVNSIQSPVDGTDLLSKADKEVFKGSIGGLGSTLETMLGSGKEVPIFEFRRIQSRAPCDWPDFADEVESELKRIHERYR
ncbi:hypothetical protein B0J11DRAFT_500830 [Dendryphion nanum]|uniref:Uncharacterized protein n=1 Tax=Dendryphion nanum TaxID=256645 RepID=A0A9P9EKB3_9PLEO|nr:hypothetical protein B0J11DRAFT_500830 [Dendryphion nanum]